MTSTKPKPAESRVARFLKAALTDTGELLRRDVETMPLGFHGAEVVRHDGQLWVVYGEAAGDAPGRYLVEPRIIVDEFTGQRMELGRVVRRLEPLSAEEYARLEARAARRTEKAVHAPIDALVEFDGFLGRVRGRAMLGQLGDVRLEALSGRLLPTTPGGKLPPFDVRRFLADPDVTRLLVAYLSAKTGPPCELGHAGKAPEAVTVLLGGTLSCSEH
jgi:hypothetical protein